MPGFIDVTGWTAEEVRRLGHADDDYEEPRKRYTPPAPQTFTADQVWACAAAAHRINEGYFKEDVWMHNATPPYRAKQANKTLVKEWLRTNNFVELTAADYSAGETYRNHFKSYTLLALKGGMNEFQTTAMKIAAKDQFTGRDMYDFSVVSCLPSVAERDQQQTAIKREIYHSESLAAAEGDTIVGELAVISCRYVAAYDKHRVTGRMGDSFVDFYFAAPLEGVVKIKAKIKQHRGDKTTQLNYVKKVG